MNFNKFQQPEHAENYKFTAQKQVNANTNIRIGEAFSFVNDMNHKL